MKIHKLNLGLRIKSIVQCKHIASPSTSWLFSPKNDFLLSAVCDTDLSHLTGTLRVLYPADPTSLASGGNAHVLCKKRRSWLFQTFDRSSTTERKNEGRLNYCSGDVWFWHIRNRIKWRWLKSYRGIGCNDNDLHAILQVKIFVWRRSFWNWGGLLRRIVSRKKKSDPLIVTVKVNKLVQSG